MVKLIRLIMLAGVMLAFVSAGSAFAAKGGNSDNTNFLNGKPFDTLNADIQVNATAIEALQTETAALQSTVNGLSISISNLELTVQENSDAIIELQNGLDVTYQELQALKLQVTTHTTSVNDSIASLQNQIDALQQQVNALTANLAASLVSLQDAIDANSTGVSSLLAQVTTLTAEILVMNGTLTNHEDRLTALEAAVVQLRADLTALSVLACGAAGEKCSSCGDSVVDPGEELDPPPGPFASAPVDASTCRFDFANVRQLYCNGTCSWSGGSSCDQADADVFCKLKTGNPLSTATSYTNTTALPEPGFSCPFHAGTFLPNEVLTLRNIDVSVNVRYQDSSILANHGSGQVIADPICTNP